MYLLFQPRPIFQVLPILLQDYHWLPNIIQGVEAVTTAGTSVWSRVDSATTTAAPPTVTTTPATSVGVTGVAFNGTVNANAANSSTFFEYGTTTSYGSTANGVPATIIGTSTTADSAIITGLSGNTL
ncbi:MAG: hypothetical protein WDM71_06120 [Ferruginibacter sp.]